jgi:anti-sigma regulatory factor (Ser/Thr protein kinase)
MNSEIEQFCEKHIFSKKMVNDILLIIEELLVIYKSQSEIINVDLRIAYSEKQNNIEIIFENIGKKGNILENAAPDDIGAMIIKNKAEKIDYQWIEGKNKLSMFLKRG